MYWYHETSLAWLRARKQYLTASDIKELIPYTPGGKQRSASYLHQKQMEIWAEKQAKVLQEDCVSRGAMARGHWLEEYAIKLFNEHAPATLPVSKVLHHWDNALIYNNHYGLSYSPDGLSIPQADPSIVMHNVEAMDRANRILAEVKCYKASAHYSAGCYTPKNKLEERWQIAAAMTVDQWIAEAYLIFFNPSCRHKMFYHSYTRSELNNEISTIAETAREYERVKPNLIMPAQTLSVPGITVTEEEVIAELEGLCSPLNP